MRISNTQVDELHKTIKQHEISLECFNQERTEDNILLEFKGSTLFFRFNGLGNGNVKITWKGINSLNPSIFEGRYRDAFATFESWVHSLKLEIEAGNRISQSSQVKTDSIYIPQMIKKISPKFDLIFNQAFEAEKLGLDLICGLGYRKSYEFLIKDYLLKKNPKSEHSKIKEKQIMPCINEYINDVSIKILAHRVLWLGNDHAHYLKLHKNKGIDDLKRLIYQTINWIDKNEELKKMEKQILKVEQQIKPKK